MQDAPQHAQVSFDAGTSTARAARRSSAALAAELRGNQVLRRLDADAHRSRGTDYVTITVAAAMTGYSAKAIRRKIESGVWLEGREFRRAPDGHVLISMKGYELWVERGRG